MTSECGSDIHFFKRIEEYTLRNGELRIPRSFVNKFWEEISNPLILLLPNCSKWEVNWKKMDAEVWLIDEWKKFAEFFSLDQNHLLVFRYVGKSQFKVVILDHDGLEIVYPLMEGSSDGADNGSSFRQCKRARFSVPSSPSTKKVKIHPRKNPNSYPTQDVETKHAESVKIYPRKKSNSYPTQDVETKYAESKRTKVDNVDEKGGRRNRRCSRSKVKTESGTALERAKSFISENPFFIRVMQRSYIIRKFLAMPADFITVEERRGNHRVSLWISEDRSWDMNFHVYRSRNEVTLGSGWADFVKDNDLKKGNVCVFEKIKNPGISFRVVIYRDPQESSPSNFSANESKETRPQKSSADRGSDGVPKNVFYGFRRCNNEISENHFALSVLKTVCIPEQLIRNHMMQNAAKVGLRVGNRTWPVKLEHYPENQCHKLCYSGWSKFMRECKVNVGDVCNFELVDKDKFIFQVRVARCID